MLAHDLHQRPLKGEVSGEPFVDHNAQRILIAGWAGLALNLFRSHIERRSRRRLDALREGMPGEQAQAKVTEQEVKTLAQEQVLRLDITVDESLVMGILQGSGDLLDIVDNRLQWQTRPLSMTVAQRPMRGILEHQKRRAVLHGEIQHAHDVRMGETCQGLCFLHKAGLILFAELGVKDFEGRTAFKVDMLAQVDLGKASLAKESSQTVVAQLLTYTVGHTFPSS